MSRGQRDFISCFLAYPFKIPLPKNLTLRLDLICKGSSLLSKTSKEFIGSFQTRFVLGSLIEMRRRLYGSEFFLGGLHFHFLFNPFRCWWYDNTPCCHLTEHSHNGAVCEGVCVCVSPMNNTVHTEITACPWIMHRARAKMDRKNIL